MITTLATAEFNGIEFILKEYTERRALLELTAWKGEAEVGRIAFDKDGDPAHFSGICWNCEDRALAKFIDGVFNAEIETWKNEHLEQIEQED